MIVFIKKFKRLQNSLFFCFSSFCLVRKIFFPPLFHCFPFLFFSKGFPFLYSAFKVHATLLLIFNLKKWDSSFRKEELGLKSRVGISPIKCALLKKNPIISNMNEDYWVHMNYQLLRHMSCYWFSYSYHPITCIGSNTIPNLGYQ